MKKLSIRRLVPNLITFISLTFGLSAIKFAIDQKWEVAVTLIVFSSFLDNLDGKLARLLKIH
jgi:CDP-diacylglycerol--serine O-phosphatidyltransferase